MPTIQPKHKAIQAYYDALQVYKDHKVRNEGALETAFQRLLDVTGRQHGWTLLPKQPFKSKAGKPLCPDGRLKDEYFTRGFWEAKDPDDDLDKAIRDKITAGYPVANIIFENTTEAVLYQNAVERYRADLSDRRQLADLLNQFYSYIEPEHDNFEKAVGDFKERVPADLAGALAAKIKDAHKDNKKFQAAFDAFFTLCKQTLNPNISEAAVDEMLVQHLLTERLIREIFDNADFTRRNVIAAEVEKVIDALVSKTFNSHEFLKSLDRFYVAIEAAARTMEVRDHTGHLDTKTIHSLSD